MVGRQTAAFVTTFGALAFLTQCQVELVAGHVVAQATTSRAEVRPDGGQWCQWQWGQSAGGFHASFPSGTPEVFDNSSQTGWKVEENLCRERPQAQAVAEVRGECQAHLPQEQKGLRSGHCQAGPGGPGHSRSRTDGLCTGQGFGYQGSCSCCAVRAHGSGGSLDLTLEQCVGPSTWCHFLAGGFGRECQIWPQWGGPWPRSSGARGTCPAKRQLSRSTSHGKAGSGRPSSSPCSLDGRSRSCPSKLGARSIRSALKDR